MEVVEALGAITPTKEEELGANSGEAVSAGGGWSIAIGAGLRPRHRIFQTETISRREEEEDHVRSALNQEKKKEKRWWDLTQKKKEEERKNSILLFKIKSNFHNEIHHHILNL